MYFHLEIIEIAFVGFGKTFLLLLLLFLPDSLQGMGAWQPKKLGNSPRPGPEVIERQRFGKEQAMQRVCSWTVQNEMTGVLGQVSAGAARRILDSATPEEIRT